MISETSSEIQQQQQQQHQHHRNKIQLNNFMNMSCFLFFVHYSFSKVIRDRIYQVKTYKVYPMLRNTHEQILFELYIL
jgi:hypothetical protein